MFISQFNYHPISEISDKTLFVAYQFLIPRPHAFLETFANQILPISLQIAISFLPFPLRFFKPQVGTLNQLYQE
jgi:hypothetical protein